MRPKINPVENPHEKGIPLRKKFAASPQDMIVSDSFLLIRKLTGLP